MATAALAMAAIAACGGSGIQVRTVAAPEAALLGGRTTFRIVDVGRDSAGHRDGNGDGYGVRDPMIHNAITSQVVHDEIKAAFEALGYRYSADRADFEVAFTATIAPIMDFRAYSYGHGGYRWYGYYGYDAFPHGYDGWGCCGETHAVGTYDRSTVVIDAVDPGGKLLWRGQGTSDWYTDPKHFMKDLRRAVKAVTNTFPPFNGALTLAVER
jgi:hypothetical protein